jgi:hypothetical protein
VELKYLQELDRQVHSAAIDDYHLSNQGQKNHKLSFFNPFALSLNVAKSGIKPVYQKSNETVKYVKTAKKSQINGLRIFGHIPI